MKHKLILLYIILSIFSNIIYSFELSKITEFSLSEVRSPRNDNIVIRGNFLYTVNSRSFEIFEIQNDTISIISDLNLEGNLGHVSLKDNFGYVATGGITSRLYRIDISNVTLPIITDTLNYLGNYANFIDGNNLFVNELMPDWSWLVHVYDNESFQEITIFPVPHEIWSMKHVSEGIGIINNTYDEIAYLYDISNPDSLSLIASGFIGPSSFPFYTDIIQDTIFVIGSGVGNVKFYDISDPFNWNLISEICHAISDFRIYEDKIIMIGGPDMRLYNISDIYNPYFCDHLYSYFDFYYGIAVHNNTLYILRQEGNIDCYDIEDNYFNEIYTYRSYGKLQSAYLYNENLYIQTFSNGIINWNLLDIYEPTIVESYFNNYIGWWDINCESNKILQFSINKYTQEVLDIVIEIDDNGDLIELDSLISQSNSGSLSYKEGVGYFKTYNYELHKYILNEYNELEEVACIPIPVENGNFYFLNENDIAYILSYNFITIINNISSNDSIEVITSLYTDIPFPHNSGEYRNYYFLSLLYPYPYFSGLIYDISDPLYPISIYNINNSGPLAIDEENQLLFIGRYNCSVYDLSTINTGIIQEIYNFSNWSCIRKIILFERYGNNYFLYLEETSASIYEYSTTGTGIDDEQQLVDDIQIYNFPNPFNNTTTISFSLKEHSHVKLSVYNIKGELVETLIDKEMDPHNNHQIIWDGRSGDKELANGIYFYKLIIGDKILDTKKCLLLR